jgi:NAD(P)-dependent dehydrogenase (short-subunit alcohol dehydrogenase family)
VNTVLPGWTVTPFTQPVLEDKAGTEWRNNRVPLGRWARAEEIANGILFLASDEASYVSGSELLMDGGTTAWWGPGPQ